MTEKQASDLQLGRVVGPQSMTALIVHPNLTLVCPWIMHVTALVSACDRNTLCELYWYLQIRPKQTNVLKKRLSVNVFLRTGD